MNTFQNIRPDSQLWIVEPGFSQWLAIGQVHKPQDDSGGAQIDRQTDKRAGVGSPCYTGHPPLVTVFKKDAANVIFPCPQKARQFFQQIIINIDGIGPEAGF